MYLHIHTVFNCTWRGKAGITASKSSQISRIREIKLDGQFLIIPEASEKTTIIITNSWWERKAPTFRMQSREDTAAKWTLAGGLTFQFSTGTSENKCSLCPYYMGFSGAGFCETQIFLYLKSCYSKQKKPMENLGVWNIFKRLHYFKQNTNSRNEAREMSGGGKGCMLSVDYLVLRTSLVIFLSPKEHTSGVILGGKPGKP